MVFVTARAPRQPVAAVLFVTGIAGIRHVMVARGEASAVDHSEPLAFTSAAEAMDCEGIRADSPAALEKALEGFGTRTRPLIVEARVDPAQYETQF